MTDTPAGDATVLYLEQESGFVTGRIKTKITFRIL